MFGWQASCQPGGASPAMVATEVDRLVDTAIYAALGGFVSGVFGPVIVGAIISLVIFFTPESVLNRLLR
jgi:hypothetical protein